MDVYIIKSQNNDVFENIALEFSMFKEAEKRFRDEKISTALLYLWQNNNTVVLGRNQNIYKECDLDFCCQKGIKISRRFTGGGAVYHDKGNLNFTFIASADIYNLKNNYEIIKNSLKKLGIECELSGRNDLTYNGKKFSGSAYYNSKYASMHHGTLLINSSSEVISKALLPNRLKLEAKGVNSIRSRIINLSEINYKIDAKNLKIARTEEFEKMYKSDTPSFLPPFSQEEFEKNVILLKSTDWIFNPKFQSSIQLEERFDWGEITIQVNIEGKKVREIEIYSDTLYYDIPKKVKKYLLNQSLERENTEKIFKNLLNTTTSAKKNKVIIDIKNLIMKLAF